MKVPFQAGKHLSVSKCTLLSTEKNSFLFLLPLCPVDPPTGDRHQQHHKANYQQYQRHHLGLKKGVESEGDTGACHAYYKGDHSKGKNTAVPRLFCAPCCLRQPLQSGKVLWGFRDGVGCASILGQVGVRVQCGQLCTGWRLTGQASRWAAHLRAVSQVKSVQLQTSVSAAAYGDDSFAGAFLYYLCQRDAFA